MTALAWVFWDSERPTLLSGYRAQSISVTEMMYVRTLFSPILFISSRLLRNEVLFPSNGVRRFRSSQSPVLMALKLSTDPDLSLKSGSRLY